MQANQDQMQQAMVRRKKELCSKTTLVQEERNRRMEFHSENMSHQRQQG